MDTNAVLERWVAEPDASALCPAILRLARGVPELREALDGLLTDPLERALAGLGEIPAPSEDLRSAVLAGVAAMDAGLPTDPAAAAALETRAQGSAEWWVPAARVHALASETRQRSARAALSTQQLPYAFPGELHEIAVHVLAAGDMVLTALHIDWLRKLSAFVADALVMDLRHCGLWFWPILRYLDADKLVRPLARLPQSRRLPPGGVGLVAAYLYRVGAPHELILGDAAPEDRFFAAVAIASDRSG